MTTVFNLIRHGSYALLDRAIGGRSPHSLSEEGRDQARRVAAALAARGVATLIASPVQRAQETAAVIGERLHLCVATDAAFAEIDFGSWTDMSFDRLRAEPGWRAWNSFRSTAGVPGGETMLCVQARVIAALIRLARDHPEGELAIVTHGDVIKAILAHFLGMPLDFLRRLEIGPGSTSRVVLYPEDAAVLAVNVPP
jgi:broad specificity phosphatase PhoE